MRKLSLSPEDLRVDSFSTQTLGATRRGTVQGHIITTRPHTCPECANTVYLTCDCRAEELMARALVTGLKHTCPECANTGPYATC